MDDQTLKRKPQTGYGFVYCYTSPSGKQYIGKTINSLQQRAGLNGKNYQGCTAFYKAIKKYGWESFSVEILKEVPLDRLDETEVQLIIYYNTTDPEKGYNIVSERQEYLASFKRIPVYSYDGKTGKFIERFDSISDAERAMSVHYGSIRRILNQLSHHVKGRVWTTEYTETVPIVANNQQANSVHIYMYDSKTGELLHEYASIREAARESGYNRWTIQEYVGRKNVKYGKKHTFRTEKLENLFQEAQRLSEKE